jgi:hypothetical protein
MSAEEPQPAAMLGAWRGKSRGTDKFDNLPSGEILRSGNFHCRKGHEVEEMEDPPVTLSRSRQA